MVDSLVGAEAVEDLGGDEMGVLMFVLIIVFPLYFWYAICYNGKHKRSEVTRLLRSWLCVSYLS